MSIARWSDDRILDTLSAQQDPEADATVAELLADGGIAAVNHVFQEMTTDTDSFVLAELPAPARDFFERTAALPPDIDLAKIRRGQEVFLRHAPTASIVLLASSLPRGYAAPCLTEILSISGDLEQHPYRRLLGVIQLLVNMSTPEAFEPGGLAVTTAQKLRLLHAGVRTLVPRYRPEYAARFGKPVDHADMLATLMAFSYLVIAGLDRLKVGLSEVERDEYYEVWRVFGVLMGIHPDGKPRDGSLVPANFAEAEAFYATYARHRFTGVEENPQGADLAKHNLEMIQALIPKALHLPGWKHLPRLMMTELLTAEELSRIGIRPLAGHEVERRIFEKVLEVVNKLFDRAAPHFIECVSLFVFRDMIDHGRGGEVRFIVPDSLADLRGSGLV